VLSIAQAQQAHSVCAVKEKGVYAIGNPVNAMYIKTSQPNRTSIACEKQEREGNQKTSPQPDRLQMHVKTNKDLHLLGRDFSELSNLSRLTRALVIKAFR